MIFGAQFAEGETIGIGSSEFLVISNPQASAQYLEFSGDGLQSLERLRDSKQEQMATIGARMLAREKKTTETERTMQMRTNGESAILATIAQNIGEAMERVLQIMADWSQISGDISVQLNTDYFEARMGADEVTAFVAAWQAGAISTETMFWNMKQGEMIPPETDYEAEQERIANQAPIGGAPVKPPTAPAPVVMDNTP